MIENDTQLANTLRKLKQLEEHIAETQREEPQTPELDESISALVEMANQFKEEIVRYQSRMKLRSAG